MPNKPSPLTTPSRPAMKPATVKSSAKPPKMSLKDLHELRTAEDQTAAEDTERKEHATVMVAVAIEPESAPETSAPGGNQAASAPARRRAIKIAREQVWAKLVKKEKFPLALRNHGEGLELYTGEEGIEAYVYITHASPSDDQDEISLAVDRYQAVLERHGIAAERLMKDLRPHLRVPVTRTDADIQSPGSKPSRVKRTLPRMADDDQYQTGNGMGI